MKKSLTIGLFVEHYEPFVSGVISSVRTLKEELQRRGHKVYIIAPSVRGHQDSDPNIIRYASLSTETLDNTTVGLPNPRIVKRLMKIKFDIIHAEEVYFSAALGLHIAHKQRIPYIQSYHTLWDRFVDQFPLKRRVFAAGALIALFTYPLIYGPRASLRLFLGRVKPATNYGYASRWIWRHMLNLGAIADRVVVPSRHLQGELSAAGLEQIDYLPNAVKPFTASRPILPPKITGSLRVLSVARLSPEKRVETLIKAAAKVPQVELIVVGDGPHRPKLEKLANRQLGRRIRFMGQRENEATRQLMTAADVLALASYDFDNQPMVILEALDAGLPIVYCDPKLKEGLTAGNSLLVDKSADGFAKGFNQLNNEKLRQAMAQASRQLAKGYYVRLASNKLLSIYGQAIKARQAGLGRSHARHRTD